MIEFLLIETCADRHCDRSAA